MKVTFKSNNETIAVMYAKASDTASDLKNIIYDPGVGEDNDLVFKGWFTSAEYDIEDEGKTIQDIRDEVKQKVDAGVTEGDEVTYYAMLFNSITVSYQDEEGVVLKTEEKLFRDGTSVDYVIDQEYTPLLPEYSDFEGWQDLDSQQVYQNKDSITLKNDLTLKAYCPRGNWISFVENKGTYTAPEFVKNAEKSKGTAINGNREKPDPTRNGYNFTGWYTDEDCTDEYEFKQEVNHNFSVYAGWTAKSNADYTVLIWKQNVDGKNYDFEKAITLNGTVGSTVNTVSQQGSGNNAYARIDRNNYQITGFHLSSFDQNVTITTEGNAVVNVYYDRTEYTLTFKSQGSWFNPGTTYKKITALYGQYIGDNFPISVNGDTTYRWEPQNGSTFDQVLVYIDIMPAEDVTFTPDSASYSTKYMEFYVEALPGQTVDRTWNGKSFVKYGNTIPAKYNFFTEAEDFLELIGYKKYGSAPDFEYGRAYVEDGGTIRFYYTRDSYPITYMDGIYVSGKDNAQLEDRHAELIKTSDPIAYEADISSYNKSGNDYFIPEKKDEYAFVGWYTDAACKQEYKFTKMPQGGVTVYAKWVKKEYRIFLHPNAGHDESLKYGGDRNTSFKIEYNTRINDGDTIYVERDDYELIAWYTDSTLQHVFSFPAFVANDTNVTDDYDKTRSTETDEWGEVISQENKDLNRPWITRSLDLYASWRSKLPGANGIKVIYDAVDGQGKNAPTDENYYKDKAEAYAGAASTAIKDNEQFLYWTIQKWDDKAGEYVDTEKNVYPGETFEVLKSEAKVEVEEWNDEAQTQIKKATYTVQLKAVYGPKEASTPTHIWWYSNFGNNEVIKKNTVIDSITGGKKYDIEQMEINQAVVIKPSDTFERPGYEFLGWSKVEAPVEGSTPEVDDELKVNFLWYKNGSFYSDAAKTKEVDYIAADEKTPYHDLYAVWAPKKYTVEITKVLAEASDETFTFTATGLSQQSFALKNGESKVFEDVPYDTKFTLKEDENANYEVEKVEVTTYDADGQNPSTTDGRDNAEYTVSGNIKIKYTNKRKTADVTVTKTLADSFADANVTFSFEAKATNKEILDTKFDIEASNKTPGKYTITDVPVGTELTITENPVTGATYDTTVDGTGTFDKATNSYTLNVQSGENKAAFTNTRKTATLNITKTVTGDDLAYADYSDGFKIHVVLTYDGKEHPQDVVLLAGGTETTETQSITVPYGATYTVSEPEPGKRFTVEVSGDGTVSDGKKSISGTMNGDKAVTVTNTAHVLPETGLDIDTSAAKTALLSVFAFAMMCVLGFSLKRRYTIRK